LSQPNGFDDKFLLQFDFFGMSDPSSGTTGANNYTRPTLFNTETVVDLVANAFGAKYTI